MYASSFSSSSLDVLPNDASISVSALSTDDADFITVVVVVVVVDGLAVLDLE